MASEGAPPVAPATPALEQRVVAVVKDLFFVARIRETARLADVDLVFARTPPELAGALTPPPRLVIIDLTADVDLAAVFATLDSAQPSRPSVLGFTTHALAARTRPWHERCDRVITKETLTAELPDLLRRGVSA